jgi:beta-phosphoglucomutase
MPDASGFAVIWDVDGTLVDTSELHYQAWNDLARQLGKPFSRELFQATFGQRNAEIIPRVFGPGHTTQEIAEIGARKEELYRAAARGGVTLLPGAWPLLQGLQEAGFRQAVGSSAPRANLDLILQLTQTRSYFGELVSMEDTHRGKPDPEVFQVAAARLGVPPPRCLVMEDAVAGVQAAKAGGMKCIGVRLGGHHPEAALQAAGADLVAHSLEQVSVAIIRHVLGDS